MRNGPKYTILSNLISHISKSLNSSPITSMATDIKINLPPMDSVFSGVTNPVSPFCNPTDESGFGSCQEKGTCLTALCQV